MLTTFLDFTLFSRFQHGCAATSTTATNTSTNTNTTVVLPDASSVAGVLDMDPAALAKSFALTISVGSSCEGGVVAGKGRGGGRRRDERYYDGEVEGSDNSPLAAKSALTEEQVCLCVCVCVCCFAAVLLDVRVGTVRRLVTFWGSKFFLESWLWLVVSEVWGYYRVHTVVVRGGVVIIDG